jgi:DinB family
MKGQGVPVTYITFIAFPNEGHGFARSENRLAFTAVRRRSRQCTWEVNTDWKQRCRINDQDRNRRRIGAGTLEISYSRRRDFLLARRGCQAAAPWQHHLLRLPHGFRAPRSEEMPDFQSLYGSVKEVDDWYSSYVGNLSESDFEQSVDFVFTNGTLAYMRRGEIILHVCMHGTYHRGNAGIVLQKNGVAPNDDRMTDFLETLT